MDGGSPFWSRDDFVVITDRACIDLDQALALLHTTSWAKAMSRERFARAFEHSLNFAMLRDDQVVGFARVVTDRATYGYLTDVVVAESLRGQGLGQWMMECLLSHADLQGLRRMSLLTVDARTLYERCGFTVGVPDDCHVYMERKT